MINSATGNVNSPTTIILATGNPHKLVEYQGMLPDFRIITLQEIGYLDDIAETGTTCTENALIKAQTIYDFLKQKQAASPYIIVAEDSGLMVDALDGAPGIYSARYAGVHNDDAANRAKLLKELAGKPRTAKFECVIAMVFPDGHSETLLGEVQGKITETERGNRGFAYDSIFYADDLGKTFAEATEDEKNRVSHRGRAIQKLRKRLEEFFDNAD